MQAMITDKLTQAQVKGASQAIDNAQKVIILTHMSPDGDALGSSLGLYWWLHKAKDVRVVVPNAFPDFLDWLPGAKDILVYEKDMDKVAALFSQADLIICSDFNDPKRIGVLGEMVLATTCPKIMIDHHLHPSDFADVTISYSDSPSASELVYRLIWQSGLKNLSVEAATCIYVGMMTDTGNFSFNSNYPEMYEIVGSLVSAGIDKDAIYNRVFNSWSAERMRLVGYCLNNKMQLYPNYHMALIYLSGKELYRFHFKSGDAEGIVNMPLSIKDIYYSCFMREDKVADWEKGRANGSKIKVKISMRSQGDRPVNEMCHDVFNGGGHMNASGGEFYGPLSEAVDTFLKNYERYFKKD